MKPRAYFLLCILVLGCTSPAIQRSQSPETGDPPESSDVKRVGDLTRTYGLDYVKLEGIALVSGLAGTGEDPPPSAQRSEVLAEMQRRSVDHAERVLASPDTALVLVRGFLGPGIQKGDRFDIEVRVPSRSEASSLRDGWLLETRLSELAVLGSQIHEGHVMALAQGPILVDPSASGDDERGNMTRGRILGGGISLRTRTLGLVLTEENQSIRVSQQIGKAINQRFHTYVRGVKEGVATPKTDEFIELIVHPRYQHNIKRYVRVVRSIPYRETPADRQHRLQLLERQLMDPVTAATAALRLEGIGKDAVEILKRGIKAQDPEIRFYTAESLAYLDQTEAAEPLAAAARDEPAFRSRAFEALGAMDDVLAHDELRSLLNADSAETRYGAFRALREMNEEDPIVRGQDMKGRFHYHIVDSQGPPMVHVTRSDRPEVILFGVDHSLKLPMVLEAGKYILVNGLAGSEVTVSRFAVGEPDQKRVVSSSLDDVIRAVVELGGTYPDVVQALQQAKESGSLASRLEVDAIPQSGRLLHRPSVDPPVEKDSRNGRLSRLFTPWKSEKKAPKPAEVTGDGVDN